MATKPLEGLGVDLKLIRRLCADDKVALDLIDKAVKGRQGNPTGHNQHTGGKGVIHPLSSSKRTPRRGKQLRRLRKDFPELHGQVLKGKLTVNECAIRAGIYPSRLSINTGSPASAAASIMRVIGKEYALRLIAELEGMVKNGQRDEVQHAR